MISTGLYHVAVAKQVLIEGGTVREGEEEVILPQLHSFWQCCTFILVILVGSGGHLMKILDLRMGHCGAESKMGKWQCLVLLLKMAATVYTSNQDSKISNKRCVSSPDISRSFSLSC